MAKIPKIKADAYRKNLVQAERQKYLEGMGKSKTWREVKQLALNMRQRTNAKVDKDIALYLPLLNFRQKRVILSLVKALAYKQDQFWLQLHKEQKLAFKKNSARREGSVTCTKVPGVDMTRVLESPPHLVKENSSQPCQPNIKAIH